MERITGKIPTGSLNHSLTRVRAAVVSWWNGRGSDESQNTSTKRTGSETSDGGRKRRCLHEEPKTEAKQHLGTGEKPLSLQQYRNIKKTIATSMWRRYPKKSVRRHQRLVWRRRLLTSVKEYPDILLRFPELIRAYPELSEYPTTKPYISLAVAKTGKERRRLRQRLTPRQWLKDDRAFCLNYWDHACAACGTSGPLQFDHWIPLAHYPECPGTVPNNMIPLCPTCNGHKHARNPQEWLIWQFGETRGADIQKRIEAYLELAEKRQNT